VHAAYITELGSPDVIVNGQLPQPVPGPTDVLVRVEATAANPVDTFVRSGAYRTSIPFPFVLGRDMVGTVVEVGPGATGFTAGERVWSHSLGHAGRQGVTAEYCVVGIDRLYHLPDGVDPARAVAVLHPAATAHLALFRHARLRPGETLLIVGGAGNVGRVATALASHAGARVLAMARAENTAECLRAGATAVVDYRDPDALEQVHQLAPDGVDVHLDTSGRPDLDGALATVGHGARIVLMAGLTARPVLPFGAVYPRDISLVGFAISNAGVDDLAATATAINHGLAADMFELPITAELPLSQTAQAHRRLEAGGVRGRIILRPDP
jgi:NADPH:quinone reductase-like Zn-dependent oxidoreductase